MQGYSPDIAPGFFSSVRVRGQPLALVAGWKVKNPDALSAANVATEPTLDEPTTSQLNRGAGFAEMMGLNGLDVKPMDGIRCSRTKTASASTQADKRT